MKQEIFSRRPTLENNFFEVFLWDPQSREKFPSPGKVWSYNKVTLFFCQQANSWAMKKTLATYCI